ATVHIMARRAGHTLVLAVRRKLMRVDHLSCGIRQRIACGCLLGERFPRFMTRQTRLFAYLGLPQASHLSRLVGSRIGKRFSENRFVFMAIGARQGAMGAYG